MQAPSASRIPIRAPAVAATDHGRRARGTGLRHRAARSALCQPTRPPGSIVPRNHATSVQAARRHPVGVAPAGVLPFAGGLFYLAPDSILKLAERIVESIRKLRVKFSGREFAEAAVEFSAALRHMGLHLESAKKVLLTEHLKK